MLAMLALVDFTSQFSVLALGKSKDTDFIAIKYVLLMYIAMMISRKPFITLFFGTEEGFIKPRAITKPDGTFEMTTYESGDGAPAGTYEVSIEQWLRAKPEESPENQLPAVLSNPSTSGLKATVADAVNDLSPFELK